MSTTATSMSSASWESSEKPTDGLGFCASSSETTAANRMRYPIPRNVKSKSDLSLGMMMDVHSFFVVMQGIPWELNEQPLISKGDIFGSLPARRQRGRKTTGMQNMMMTRPFGDLGMDMEGPSNVPKGSAPSSSSDGCGSISNNCVPTDEGFTDYLADESELELQAETRAAFIALNQAEELEFKMAREQLKLANLRPPKPWNPSTHTSHLVKR